MAREGVGEGAGLALVSPDHRQPYKRIDGDVAATLGCMQGGGYAAGHRRHRALLHQATAEAH